MNYPEDIISKIDGPLFKQQRAVLRYAIVHLTSCCTDCDQWTPEDIEALDGLNDLLDTIADCAHDIYGIPCLDSQEDDNGETQ
jgi:hypothetical protein